MLRYDLHIIHNPILTERKIYLKKMLNTSIDAKFIEIENCAPDLISFIYCGLNIQQWTEKCRNLWDPVPSPRTLTKGEIAATASHFYSYAMFLESSDKDWLVVIEDDAIFNQSFIKDTNLLLEETPPRCDALFIGGGFPHEAVSLTLGKYKNFIIKHHPATNSAVGYAIRRKMLCQILRDFKYFDHAIDFELAYLLMKNNALVLHVDPYIVQEGSKMVYKSSLRPSTQSTNIDSPKK